MPGPSARLEGLPAGIWIPGEAEVLMFGLGRAEGGAGWGTSDDGEEQASSCVSGSREKNVPLTGAICLPRG